MNAQKFAEEVFKEDSRVRYVGIVDNQFHIVFSRMRDGVQSITSGEEYNFVQIMPPIIVDAVAKLEPMLGKLDNVTIRYEKVMLVFFRAKDATVVVSFGPETSTPFISAISGSIHNIIQAHFTDSSVFEWHAWI